MATVRGMDVCKFHPFLVIPASADLRQVKGEGMKKVRNKCVRRYIYLIYASRSLSMHRWPMCSILVLFLSSSPGKSEGYMERGVPAK